MSRICPTCQRAYDYDTVFCPKDATVLSLEPDTILLKKYRIVAEIARGGMAVIYRARHLHYDEDMALKILNEPVLGRENTEPEFAGNAQAFVAEARLLRRLHHPNIVRVEDADFLDDGRPFLAMEFVEGEDLAARMRRVGPMPVDDALRIAAQICAGLAAAHDAGMIHRDINPKNILLAREEDGSDTVKLIDFGIAKVRKDAGIGFTAVQRGTTGFFLGTPRYASPEQARLKPLDYRTDIYSTGLVLYEMLTGRLPAGGDTDEAVLENRAHLRLSPPDRLRPGLPPPVSAIVMRALEADPAARYESASEMQSACTSAAEGLEPAQTEPAPPRRGNSVARRALTVAVSALALLAGGWLGWRLTNNRTEPPPIETTSDSVPQSGDPRAPTRRPREPVSAAIPERRNEPQTPPAPDPKDPPFPEPARDRAATARAPQSTPAQTLGADIAPPLAAPPQTVQAQTATTAATSAERSATPARREETPPAQQTQSVQRVLDRWVAATKSGNIAGRLALYAFPVNVFYTKRDLDQTQLAQELREAYSRYAEFSAMHLSNVSIVPLSPGLMEAQFDKDFTAVKPDGGETRSKVHSQLTLKQTDAGWKIVSERDTKVY